MKFTTNLNDTLFVLFGASGDLAWRLVVPALFDLFLDGYLPARFQLLAVDRSDKNDAEVALHFLKGITENSRRGTPADAKWQTFAAKIRHLKLNVTSSEDFQTLAGMLTETEQQWASQAIRIFYLATPSTLFEPIATGLGKAGLSEDRNRVRLVVEKPLGNDLESFHKINDALGRIFEERQLFRIDHFLIFI